VTLTTVPSEDTSRLGDKDLSRFEISELTPFEAISLETKGVLRLHGISLQSGIAISAVNGMA